ncbi:MAG: S41 family peptidase [Anaerolineae bacterium]|jgi:hypothetical protein
MNRVLSPSLCLLLVAGLVACAAPAAAIPAASPSTAAPEPTRAEAVHTPQELQEDLSILRTTLEEAHPGLYLYADPATRGAQFDAVAEQIDQPMSGMEFYRLVAPLVAGIHDGHTVIWPPQDAAVYAPDQDLFLPVRLRFLEGQAYVAETLTPEAGLARGSQVLSINGRDMAGIVARLLPYVPHDGLGQSGPYFYLGDLFPMFYGWSFEPAGAYELEIRDPNTGQEATVIVPAMNVVDLSAILNQPAGPDEDLKLEMVEDGTVAVMTIGWFGATGIEPYLETSFARIQELGIHDLIIDLRGNGGGNGEHGAQLYSYLSREPFEYYDHLGAVLEAPPTFADHTDLAAPEYEAIVQRLEQTEEGERHYPHWYGLDQPQLGRPDAFAGPVYVLIDGGCGSSTTEFAAIAHYNQRATFVGEETGGTYYGNNSGTMPTLTLPHSGITVVIPLFQFVMAVPGASPERGIPPDYEVKATPEEFAAGTDAVLAFTLDLIRDSR